jgi:outer membrane biosynthesis protein TonB
MFVAIVFVRYASAPDGEVADDQLERSELAAAATPDPQPVAAPEPEPTPVASAPIEAPVVKPLVKPIVEPRPKKAVTVRSVKTRVAAPEKSTAPIVATAITKRPAAADASVATVQATPVSAESVGPAAVTLTGCLEISVDRDEFRLNDTDGVDAPRARSWRTGFLKKRPTPVALVEPPDPHGLQNQVGKRVAATGQLTDRELRVSAVRVVGPSCD